MILDNKRIITILSAVIFIFALYNTAAFMPYIIVAVLGCLFIPYKFSKKTNGIAICTSIIISSLIAMTLDDITKSILVITAGPFLFYGIIQTVMNFSINEKQRNKKVFWMAFIPISATFLIFLFCFNFPGTLCIDSGESIEQIISGNYWNHHPVFYTWTIQLILQMAGIFTNSWIAKIAFYSVVQSIIFALAISYAITAIRNTRFILPVILAYIVLPYHMNYAVTMTKDTLWVAALIVFTTIMYLNIKGNKSNHLRQILFFISIFAICLYRTNGTVIMLSVLIGSIIFFRKKNVILPLIFCISISYFLRYPFLYFLSIPQPDIGEKTVMLQQQLGRVLANKSDVEGKEELNKLIDLKYFPQIYKEDYADSIKHRMRFGNTLHFIEDNKKLYFDIWLKNGLKYPDEYIKAFIAQTRFWYSSQPNEWVVYNFNKPGISAYFGRITPELVASERELPYLNTFLKCEPLTSVGMHTWWLFLLTAYSYIKRDKKILLLIPYITMLFTLILSAPTMEFRYMYGWFSILPVLIPMLFLKGKTNEKIACHYSGI